MKYILILIGIAILTHFRWVSFHIFTYGDWWYFFPETMKDYLPITVWNSIFGFGSFDLTLWRFPIINLPYGIFGNFALGQEIAEKFIIFWPTIILANIFSFALFKKILKSDWGAFVGALVFNYNTYYLIIGGGFLIYSATPWVLISLLIFINALDTGKKYLYAVSGLTLFISGSYDFRMAYIGAFLLFIYLFYHTFFVKNSDTSVKSFKNLFYSFISLIVFGLLNIYWLLPTLKLGSLTSNAVLSRGLFGNEFLNILYAITLYHPFWTITKPTIFNVQPIMLYFWLIPIFAFLGFWLNRKDKKILFFGIIALLGIFLTKQVAHPFPLIYPWLFAHIPGFNAFREASKFYFLIALGYSVLIGSFVREISEKSNNIKISRYAILPVAIILIFLLNTKSFISGEIGTMYVPREVPKDYFFIKRFVLQQPVYFRTLWLPISTRWTINTNTHPDLSGVDISTEWSMFIKKEINTNKYSEAELQIKILSKQFSNNLLDVSSIKYVIIPLQEGKNDDFFLDYGKPRQYYINQLNKLPYLKKINIGTKDVVVYENNSFRPHIYITNNQETIYKDLRSMIYDVRYKFINPTEYTFSVKNVKSPFYLNFSESYHPQWNIRVGNFNWIDVLTKSNYFIDDKNHFQNDATLNSYYINPTVVCNVYKVNNVYKVGNGCVRNVNGSYDISGTLYFKPQSYLYFGLIISGAALVTVLSYLFFVLGKNLYERKD